MNSYSDPIRTTMEEHGITKSIIKQNVYHRFGQVKQSLMVMEIGDMQQWPANKGNYLRSLSNSIREETGRAYKVRRGDDRTQSLYSEHFESFPHRKRDEYETTIQPSLQLKEERCGM